MREQDSLYLDALVLAFMLCPGPSHEETVLEIAVEHAFQRLGLTLEEQQDFLHAAAMTARGTDV